MIINPAVIYITAGFFYIFNINKNKPLNREAYLFYSDSAGASSLAVDSDCSCSWLSAP